MNREEQIHRLQKESFDILIIGGGATGAGSALDAATRGLKVALVERDDFAAGTSSRSTKLIHGGVRYLEQAVLKFDMSQFKLVRDALHERATLIKIAPHLSRPLPILTPLYHRMDIPYYRTGLRLYDRLAGKKKLHKSFFVSAKEAVQKFPMLRATKLRGGVIYYDGQFDDARMNVCIALTGVEQGACAANHITVTELIKKKGRVAGAKVKDRFTGKTWDIDAKVVINATGPFLDSIRLMDDPQAESMLSVSSGTHIILDKKFSPPNTGLLIPKTEDGRVLFILPWLGHTLIGTTDNPARVEVHPKPTDEDLDYLLRQVKAYFSLTISKPDILSSWTGLRPLISNPKASDTAKLSRDHVIHESESGLITIGGGKWTTYRKMAADTIDHAIQVGKLKPKSKTKTETVPIAGGEKYSDKLVKGLRESFKLPKDVAEHLHHAYGSRAKHVAKLAKGGLNKRIVPHLPYIEAEIVYSAREESARTTTDVLARRTRLAFLSKEGSIQAVDRVSQLLGETLHRDAKEIDRDKEEALAYLG